MSIPSNNTIITSSSQPLPPMRKLNFEDDDSTTVTTSVTDIPVKPFSHLFLKKERKIQSDSFLQLQPKKQFDFFDGDNDLPCQPADRKELAGLMSRSQRLPSVGKSLIGMMSSKSTPPCKMTLNTDFKGEDLVIKEEPHSGNTVKIEEVQQDCCSEAEERSEVSQQDKKDLAAEMLCLTQECASKLSLSTSKNIRDPDLNSISPQTVAGLLYESESSKYIVIDCRYNYEYQGGHIKGAILIESPELLEKIFFTHKDLLYNPSFVEDLKKDLNATLEKFESYNVMLPDEKNPLKLPLIIFHCEFSQKRGPRAFRLLRAKDRELNIKNWPNLYFPEIYVLDGGYSNFYAQFPEHCEGGYMRMVDKNLKKEFAIAKENYKKLWSKKDMIEVDETE